jgi:anaerobic selenocysteine-containing dehydrogenase
MSKRRIESITKELSVSLSRRQFVKRLVQGGALLGLGLSTKTAFAAACTGFLTSYACTIPGSCIVNNPFGCNGQQQVRCETRTQAVYSNGKQTSGTQYTKYYCPGQSYSPNCENTCG